MLFFSVTISKAPFQGMASLIYTTWLEIW